jgi:oleandomycin transport system permease protein
MVAIAQPVRYRRMGPVRVLRHSLTLAWRALAKIRHNPEQLLDVSLQPIVFVTLFVFLFGGAITGGDRHAYLQFVLPGIIVQTIVFSSMTTGVNLCTDISTGIFDRFRSLPIARSSPLTGLILGDIVRYLVSLAVVVIYGVIIGFRFQTNPLAVLVGFALVMLFALSVCWIWTLAGLLLKRPQSMQGVGFVIGFPLTFGSNIFVQTQTLPGWLQSWVKVNPVTQLAEAVRGLTIGGPTAKPVLYTLLWSAAIMAVFVPLAVTKYRRTT